MFWSFNLKFENSTDITECCIVEYNYSIVGYVSIYSNKDFSPLKNDLFDFQLALLSNELEFLYAVFGKTICFGSSISILQLHWKSLNFVIWSLKLTNSPCISEHRAVTSPTTLMSKVRHHHLD